MQRCHCQCSLIAYFFSQCASRRNTTNNNKAHVLKHAGKYKIKKNNHDPTHIHMELGNSAAKKLAKKYAKIGRESNTISVN